MSQQQQVVGGFPWPLESNSTMVKDQILPEPDCDCINPKKRLDPNDPDIVNPTGEFGPESYIDTGAYSPAKYLIDYKKRKAPKKVDEGKKKKAIDHCVDESAGIFNIAPVQRVKNSKFFVSRIC